MPKTSSGDIAEVKSVGESSSLWPQVTSTVDNCIGQECHYFDDCYVNLARKKAATADLVVVNHHLYFADKALKNDGFGALLPEAQVVVFDEAHQLPDIAANFLGSSFSSWQIHELVSDAKIAEQREKSLIKSLIPALTDLDKLSSDYRLSLGIQERRVAWHDLVEEIPTLPARLENLATMLSKVADILEKAAVKGDELQRCYERALELAANCQALSSNESISEYVRWVEIAKRSFRIHETPLDIGSELETYFSNSKETRVFTSATLTVNGDFQHFAESIGTTKNYAAAQWESPFDYFEQSVLYVPDGLPDPRDQKFTEHFFASVLPVLKASQGGVFILFTSFRQLDACAQMLEEQMEDDEFTVLIQGQTTKRALLEKFSKHDNAVLLATMSFWEGVDVPGDALRCVIIDKLPFESPFDPVIKARLQAIEDAGANPFMAYQVPRAVITLRQGAGRLIRSSLDKGVLMIC
ncbi:MAG: ATP-dependent DNA helicase, partial [Pseudomonadota bacterium]